MSVNVKVTGGLNIEWGQIDPKVTGGLRGIKATGGGTPKVNGFPGLASVGNSLGG